MDPVRTFGNAEQKRRFLPGLADGSRLSAFALTEPCAGSDLTALRTTARLDGDQYVVNGEKLFITNVVPGRTIGLVCLIEGKPAVLIVELHHTYEAVMNALAGLDYVIRPLTRGGETVATDGEFQVLAYPREHPHGEAVWADVAASLFEESKSRRWAPARDVPWSALDTPSHDEDRECALRQLATSLISRSTSSKNRTNHYKLRSQPAREQKRSWTSFARNSLT